MRGLTPAALIAVLLLAPVGGAATAQTREATFPVAQGFDDRMTVVSGAMELDAPAVTESAAFFRTTGADIRGLTKVCWQAAGLPPQCADGPLRIVVPRGVSFGFNSQVPYRATVTADHALASFVDLSQAEGVDAS
ncbi:MAG TPA: hypothetical protein VJ874_03475, partial [Candidatus Thermoplasmatota archaeon]|nr:hypothetical protein [Candidatus Thermoplasmatota archaeon]